MFPGTALVSISSGAAYFAPLPEALVFIYPGVILCKNTYIVPLINKTLKTRML
jgi:hypothetical protein